MYRLCDYCKPMTLVLAVLCCSAAVADDGLLLPMPGKTTKKTASSAKKTQQNKQTKTTSAAQSQAQTQTDAYSGGEILPLPSHISHKTRKSKQQVEQTAADEQPAAAETKPEEAPLIQIIPPESTNEQEEVDVVIGDESIPVPPDEVVVSTDEAVDKIIPPPDASEPTTSVMTDGESYPIFPKDTSSAIFMVMKSWQCADYSFGSLLKQAVQSYGEDADDAFAIQGLDTGTSDLPITLEEEDITLDELLDIIGQKVGRDWGVDIPQKIIYFYPPGISASTYSAW